MKKISDLEGDQRSLAMDSKGLADQAEAAQARRMESAARQFLAKAKQNSMACNGASGRAAARGGFQPEARIWIGHETASGNCAGNFPPRNGPNAGKERRASGGGFAARTEHAGGARRWQAHILFLDSYGAQINEAGALAQDLAADLAKLVPRGEEALAPAQREQARAMGERQTALASARNGWRRKLDKGQVAGWRRSWL